MTETIESPLSDSGKANLVGRIPVEEIISGYKDKYDLDVSDYFSTMNEVKIFECVDTHYRFYFPYSLEGKEPLYRHLKQLPRSYKEDKWEHRLALDYVKKDQKVIDIGCGTGNFLYEAKTIHGADVSGIELNGAAAETARERGLNVTSENLADLAKKNPNYYDVVCAFQVLEHIADVKSFVTDCIKILKPGGALVFGVPNNDAFIKYDTNAVLNGPPHHMGLWTKESLKALPKVFEIDLKTIEIEPLKEKEWYQALMENRYLPKRWQRSLYYRLGGAAAVKKFIDENSETIAGHTVMAIYLKREV